MPGFGLVYSCRQICHELRPQWLELHIIPMEKASVYVDTFFPDSVVSANHYTQFLELNGTLRMKPAEGLTAWDNTLGYQTLEVLPILKHKARYPSRMIEIVNHEEPLSINLWSTALQDNILNNTEAAWLKHVTQNVFHKVQVLEGFVPTVKIVLRKDNLQSWMVRCQAPTRPRMTLTLRDFGLVQCEKEEKMGWLERIDQQVFVGAFEIK